MKQTPMRIRTETAYGLVSSGQAAEPAAIDLLVDEFAAAIKAKLFRKYKEGRCGWDSADWTSEQISAAIREHVERGDPVDVAAFCAFLWNRRSQIAGREKATP